MTKQDKVYSYHELRGMIERSRNQEVKLTNNTTARIMFNGKIAIRLHYTDIIIIDNKNHYKLYTGGWYTPTTLSRLNGFSPARVMKKNGLIYLKKSEYEGSKKNNLISFEEGITVDEWGDLYSPELPIENKISAEA